MVHDEALVERGLAGERVAFEALVEAYWPVAERVAYGVLKDAQLAQDVAQEVFADIYVQRTRYQKRFSFHAYVAAIARYKSIDMLRRRKQPLSLEDVTVGDAWTPESQFIDSMFRHSLYTAVERLPQQQRRMLMAFALEGRTYRDIAEELGITTAQVKITLFRVRKQLRRIRDAWDG